MVGLGLAAFWLGLVAPAPTPDGRGAGGVVVADALDVLDEPDDSGYSSGALKPGDRVRTVPSGGLKPGWLAIAPPPDAFDWVDAAAIRKADGDARGEVVADRAPVRIGTPGAKLPGPARPSLPKGETVRLLDRPALTVGQGPKARTWLAIEPPGGEVRYVHADGVRLDPPAETTADAQVRPTQARPPARTPDGPDDPASRFAEAVRRSRRIDAEVEQTRQTLARSRTASDRTYDAKGLLQASSRQVDGQRVHALIGPEGVPIAYLAIPPGITASRLLARKVGVRGDVHYNESLGARLITVRDLDPLDRPR